MPTTANIGKWDAAPLIRLIFGPENWTVLGAEVEDVVKCQAASSAVYSTTPDSTCAIEFQPSSDASQVSQQQSSQSAVKIAINYHNFYYAMSSCVLTDIEWRISTIEKYVRNTYYIELTQFLCHSVPLQSRDCARQPNQLFNVQQIDRLFIVKSYSLFQMDFPLS